MKKSILILFILIFSACSLPAQQPTPMVITATTAPTATDTPEPELPEPTSTRTPIAEPTATQTIVPEETEIITFQAVINAERLNLRESPTISAEVLEQMEEGEIVTVIGKYGGGEWVKVRTEDFIEGWFYAEYLLLQGDVADLVDLDVENGIRISGRVMDSFGNPVNDVQLTLIGVVSQDLVTDKDGYFETLLAPGMTGIWEIRIGMPKCTSSVMDLNCNLSAFYYYNPSVLIELPDPSAAVFIFEQATGTISGMTIGQDELPEGNLRVVAVREDGAMSSVYSNEEGSFRLPIGQGAWRISITHLNAEGESIKLEIGEFQSVDEVLLYAP